MHILHITQWKHQEILLSHAVKHEYHKHSVPKIYFKLYQSTLIAVWVKFQNASYNPTRVFENFHE